MATTYLGRLDETLPPVMFGQEGVTTCVWRMTLRELKVELGIQASGQLASGQVQALYHEEIVNMCMDQPAPQSIMNYTLTSSVPESSGMKLTFQEKAGDHPGASLSALLTSAGPGYQAALTFERTDLSDVYKWKVITTVVLAKQ
jgi:hypothetical protein